MQPRTVLESGTTPDGAPLELVQESGHHVIRIRGRTLMSSQTRGSERAMAHVGAELLGDRARARVLVGGLGMGFTCRAALDAFRDDAAITVAELLPAVVKFNEGTLGPLAGHPLRDRRVEIFAGDVREALRRSRWDAILLDVDNSPDAFTVESNARLYDRAGVRCLAEALRPGGVLVVWSAEASPRFESALRRAGLRAKSRRVFARDDVRKGPKHVLITGQAPGRS